jgi:quercetin dioxygenase-like cupin family protein
MKHFARRRVQLGLMTLGSVGLFVAVNAVPGAATPAVDQTFTVLARGTVMNQGRIPTEEGLQVVTLEIFTKPGGSSGWHSHPGGAIVVIEQGEVTLTVVHGDECTATRFTAGQTFIELPGEVGNAINTGSIMTHSYGMFPGVPVGGSPRIDQPEPASCSGTRS